jgi:tetratricopeptide (TPR) repeat protein
MTFNKAKALRQAEKHVQQGKINAAIEDYAKIAEFDPADLTVINTLGDLLVRAGRVEEAIVNFTKIAENYRENGFTLKAIAMFKKISKLDPQNLDISLKLAALYSQQGLLVEARQQYLQVADHHAKNGKTQKALDVYQKIADLDPENTSVRLKLAETYLRENMREPAHDAFVAAGRELVRKNKTQPGLQASLQALQINPDSKPALTAVSEAYIALGDPARAIELLKDAFDKNPGDVDFITILGRTYLAAGMMDEAEGTFTTLVQLDKSRYDFVLEVGRKFAEFGLLDRAAEQLDACVDVLISRREEDKAIAFLHDLLDRDLNHVPSLARLADIYARIREDHNLVSTLDALAEAATRAGRAEEAIHALKRLVSLEPENPSHRMRLQALGLNTEEISAIPTSSAYGRGLGSDPTVERDIADAARLGRSGDIPAAIMILEQVLDRAPDTIEAREHLRELYTSQQMNDRAAAQCRELARIYEMRNDPAKVQEMFRLAEQLRTQAAVPFNFEGPSDQQPRSFDFNIAPSDIPAAGGFGASVQDWSFGAGASSGFDFVTPVPPPPAAPERGSGAMGESALRDELEGVDFYIAQGYLEIARDTLDRLGELFPGNSEIAARYVKLKSTAELRAQMESLGSGAIRQIEEASAPSEFDLSSMFTPDTGASSDSDASPRAVPSPFSTSELSPPETTTPPASQGFDFSAPFDFAAPPPDRSSNVAAPQQTLNARVDSSRSIPPPPGDFGASFDFTAPPAPEVAPKSFSFNAPPAADAAPKRQQAPPQSQRQSEQEAEAESEAVILDDLIGDLDDQFSAIERKGTTAPVEAAPVEEAPRQAGSTPLELQDIFDEFKSSFEVDASQDFDTHYNLGIAYRDMELLDDAIEEFQSAFRTTAPTADDGRYIQCCNMLGLCFMAKDMPRLAVMWFKKGIDAPGRTEDEYQALRFDLGLSYERMGDVDRAIDVFSEVYAIDVNYRNVAEKLRELQESHEGN